MGKSGYELPFDLSSPLPLLTAELSGLFRWLSREQELVLVLSGTVFFRSAPLSCQLSAGELLLPGPGELCALSPLSPPVRLLIIRLEPALFERALPTLRRTVFDEARLRACMTGDPYDALLQALLALVRDARQPLPERELLLLSRGALLLRRMLLSVPHHLLSAGEDAARQRKRERLERVLSYVQAHLTEPIRLRELAEQEGVTLPYLSHVLHDSLGLTFQDYLNDLRFQQALSLMEDPSLTLQELAQRCGFSDSRYLTRLFSQRLGLSAKEYRAELAAGTRQPLPASPLHLLTAEEGALLLNAIYPPNKEDV